MLDPFHPGRVLAAAALALLPVLAALAFWFGQQAFFILFAGILLAAVLDAATRGLTGRLGLPRTLALTLTVVVLTGAVLGGLWLGGAALAGQAGDLARTLEAQIADLGARIEDATGRDPTDLAPTDVMDRFGTAGGGMAMGVAQGTFGALANAFVIFFIGLFLAIDPGLYARGVTALFPTDRRGAVAAALARGGRTLRRWLVGKLISMACIALLTGAGLLVAGFPFAVPLAVLAGLLAFVPNLGPLLFYLPLTLIGLGAGTSTLLWGLGAYVVAQSVESYVFTPLIQKRMVSLPPALILFAQVLGGVLFGLWGIALATPLTAVLREWIATFYVRRGLEGVRSEAPESPREAPPSSS
ncbi:MAG: AI-2E family transporter [Paracoccaceae bacterium]